MRRVTFGLLFIAMFGMEFSANVAAQSARFLRRTEATPIIIPAPRFRPGVPSPAPIWSGRALLSIIVNDTPTPVLNSMGRDGRNEEIRLSAPGWSNFVLLSLWGSDDGQIIAAGDSTGDEGERSGFIARIGSDRTQVTIMPVKEISIRAMTVGPGGMIWAVGSGKDKETGIKHDNILARFSPDGKLLSSTMLIFPAIDHSEDVTMSSQMLASSDGVSWLTSGNDYLEFAPEGRERMRIPGPVGAGQFPGRLAVSFGNTVLISRQSPTARGKPSKLNVWALDRIKQEWFLSEPSDAAFPPATSLYGFDGNTLLTSGFSKTLGQLLVRYELSETK